MALQLPVGLRLGTGSGAVFCPMTWEMRVLTVLSTVSTVPWGCPAGKVLVCVCVCLITRKC